MKGILALVLPDPERTDLAHQSGLDVPLWSFLIGIVEFIGVGAYLFHDGQQFVQGVVSGNVELFFAEKGQPSSFEESLALLWSGALAWLIWIARPYTWLLGSFVVAGVGRMVAFGLNRQGFGEPVVWGMLRLSQLARRLLRGSQRKVQEGPLRRDRWLREPGCDRVLLTCRERPEWNEYVTIEIDEKFYRLKRVEERPDGAFRAYAYLLTEAPAHEIIRSLVRYEPVEEVVARERQARKQRWARIRETAE